MTISLAEQIEWVRGRMELCQFRNATTIGTRWLKDADYFAAVLATLTEIQNTIPAHCTHCTLEIERLRRICKTISTGLHGQYASREDMWLLADSAEIEIQILKGG